MGTEINLNQFVTAANFAANETNAKNSARSENRTGKTKGVRSKFADILHKADQEIEVDPYLPVEIAGMEFEEALSFLLDAATLSAENFKKNPYTEAFADYRKKISQFMRFVVKNCYDVEESLGTPSSRVPRPKRKYIIKVIDEKLDQLARELLENHVDQLKLLARVDEINGLLVDMIS